MAASRLFMFANKIGGLPPFHVCKKLAASRLFMFIGGLPPFHVCHDKLAASRLFNVFVVHSQRWMCLSAASRLFNVFVVHSRRWMCLSAASRLSICLIRLIALNVFVGGPPPFAIFVEYCCASIEQTFVRVIVVSAQSSASIRVCCALRWAKHMSGSSSAGAWRQKCHCWKRRTRRQGKQFWQLSCQC